MLLHKLYQLTNTTLLKKTFQRHIARGMRIQMLYGMKP